jgi:hypothetical protein
MLPHRELEEAAGEIAQGVSQTSVAIDNATDASIDSVYASPIILHGDIQPGDMLDWQVIQGSAIKEDLTSLTAHIVIRSGAGMIWHNDSGSGSHFLARHLPSGSGSRFISLILGALWGHFGGFWRKIYGFTP